MKRALFLFLFLLGGIISATTFPYWVEEDNSTIWVKGNATTNATTQFYIYSNFSNGSLSSIDDVVLIGDDFNDGSVNWSKWASASPSKYTITNNSFLTLTPAAVAEKIYYNLSSPMHNVSCTAVWNLVDWATYSGFYFCFNVTSIISPLGTPRFDQRSNAIFTFVTSLNYTEISSPYATWYKSTIYYPDSGIVNMTTHYQGNGSLHSWNYGEPYTYDVWLSFLQYDSGLSLVDYAFCNQYQSGVSVVCGDLETGSFYVGGGSATSRRQCNVTTNVNVSDYQFAIPYSLFNDTDIYISDEESGGSPPNITLVSPTQNYNVTGTNRTISFTFFAVSGESSTMSCSLYLDGVANQTNATTQNNTNTTFSVDFTSAGAYSWYVSCNDGETGYSETRNLTIFPVIDFTSKTLADGYAMNEMTSNNYIEVQSFLDEIDNCTIEINGANYSGALSNTTICYYDWHGLTDINYTAFVSVAGATSSVSRSASFSIAADSEHCTDTQLTYGWNIINLTSQLILAPKTTEPTSYPDCVFEHGIAYTYQGSGTTGGGSRHLVYFTPYTCGASSYSQGFSVAVLNATFQTPYPFLENRSIYVGPLSYGASQYSYDASISTINGEISVASSGDGQYLNLSFYNNKTVCLQRTGGAQQCILSNDTAYTFTIIMSGQSTPASYSYSGCTSSLCGGGNAWFCNASYNIPTGRTALYPWAVGGAASNSDYGLALSNYSSTAGNTYTIFFGSLGGENFGATINTLSSSPPDTFVMIRNATNTYTQSRAFSYGNISSFIQNTTATPPYSAYVLTTNSQIILPTLSYYPRVSNDLTYNVFLTYFYHPTTYATRLVSDVPAFVVDSAGLCYFVPPYAPSDPSITQTLTAYQVPCDVMLSYSSAFPLLPYHQVCQERNGTYAIDVRFTNEVVFERYLYGSVDNVSVVSAEEYQENITDENLTRVELYANGVRRCYYDATQENIFLSIPLNSTSVPSETLTALNYLIGVPIILTTAALSTIHPFVFIFTVAFNDVFHVLPAGYMFFLAVGIGLFAVMGNWHGERTMKTLLILLLITAIYISQVYSYEEYTSSSMTQLSTLIQNLLDLFGGVSSGESLTAIITSVLPTFLLNLIILILSFPAVIIGLIFDALAVVSPALASALSPFEVALVAGAYVWIILKGYEMGRNMFRPI